MKYIKNSFVGFIAMLVIVIAVTLLIPALTQGRKSDAALPPPILDVNVINTSSEAVPVTGMVNVGNIGMSPLLVRDVDSPARQPVFFNESYTVPNGKRLVVEYVSMGLEAPQQCSHLIAGLTQGSTLLHMYHLTFVGTFSSVSGVFYRYVLSQEARAYVGPNRTVTLELRTYSGCVPDVAHAGVSGYLLDSA